MSIGAVALLLAQAVQVPAPPSDDPAPARAVTPPSDDPAPARAVTPPSDDPAPARAATPPSDDSAPARAATPPPATTIPPSTSRPAPERVGTSLKLGVGAYYERLYDVPIVGGALSLAIGPFKNNRTTFLALELDHGNTDHGLSTWGGRVLFAPEWSFAPVRLGFAAGMGYLQIARITDDSLLTSFTFLCSEVHASVDLMNIEGAGAFYLVAAFHADMHFPLVWGPLAALGYRTDSL